MLLMFLQESVGHSTRRLHGFLLCNLVGVRPQTIRLVSLFVFRRPGWKNSRIEEEVQRRFISSRFSGWTQQFDCLLPPSTTFSGPNKFILWMMKFESYGGSVFVCLYVTVCRIYYQYIWKVPKLKSKTWGESEVLAGTVFGTLVKFEGWQDVGLVNLANIWVFPKIMVSPNHPF